jgi:hypothetical protein
MKYQKSQAGLDEVKRRNLVQAQRQRSALILFDGHRTVSQVLEATRVLGVGTDDIASLVSLGLLVEVSVTAIPSAVPQTNETSAHDTHQTIGVQSHADRYKLAYPLAVELTGAMGLRGYRLNLAVEGAGGVDDLIALFPKIKEALGQTKCAPLEKILFE